MAIIKAVPGVSPSSAKANIANNGGPTDIHGRSDPNWVSPVSGTRGGSGSSLKSTGSGSTDSVFKQYMAMIQANAAQNNAWSAQQAQINRDWQEKMVQQANQFNSQEAQKNRDWQERMSNTSYQRAVTDLQAAGLNPVLAAMHSGASTTSGATASSGGSPSGGQGQTDTSASMALASILGSLLNLEGQRLSAQTNLAVAEKYTAMSKYTAELSSKTQLTTTNIQTAASKWIAELQSKTNLTMNQAQQATTKIVAQIQAATQRYGYQLSSWTSTEVARINGQINKELKQMGIDADFKLQDTQLAYNEMHPSNVWQAGGTLVDKILNNNSAKSSLESRYRTSGAESFMEQSVLGTLLGWYK